MATAVLSQPAKGRVSALRHVLEAGLASFRWAVEMNRRCDAHAARGHLLDGEAIARIAREVDAALPRDAAGN